MRLFFSSSCVFHSKHRCSGLLTIRLQMKKHISLWTNMYYIEAVIDKVFILSQCCGRRRQSAQKRVVFSRKKEVVCYECSPVVFQKDQTHNHRHLCATEPQRTPFTWVHSLTIARILLLGYKLISTLTLLATRKVCDPNQFFHLNNVNPSIQFIRSLASKIYIYGFVW